MSWSLFCEGGLSELAHDWWCTCCGTIETKRTPSQYSCSTTVLGCGLEYSFGVDIRAVYLDTLTFKICQNELQPLSYLSTTFCARVRTANGTAEDN